MQERCESTETLIAMHLNKSVKALSRYIRNIPNLICPVFNIAYEIQKEHGLVNLKAVKWTDNGILMSSICANTRISKFHPEEDCTYIIAKIPDQNKEMNMNTKHQRMFMVSINDVF